MVYQKIGCPPYSLFRVFTVHRAFLMRNSEADKTFSYWYFARFLADLTCLQLFFIALRSHRKADPRQCDYFTGMIPVFGKS